MMPGTRVTAPAVIGNRLVTVTGTVTSSRFSRYASSRFAVVQIDNGPTVEFLIDNLTEEGSP